MIGLTTFLMRAIFLFYLPSFIKDDIRYRKSLESVPSALLVVLVIPYALFVDSQLVLYRTEVLAILFTIPIIWITKKPGLSLLIGMLVLVLLNQLILILQ